MNFKTADVSGLRIFYCEAGDPSKPNIVLLHGFPSGFFTRKNPRQPTICSRRSDMSLRHLLLRRHPPPKPKPSMLVPQTGRNAKEWSYSKCGK